MAVGAFRFRTEAPGIAKFLCFRRIKLRERFSPNAFCSRASGGDVASFEPVRAILRGLEVLRVVSEHGPIGATDVAKRVALPQPPTVRILETLVEAGYVYRNPAASTFGVTARTKTFSRGYDATSRLVQLVQPMIEDLRKQIGWPSNLAVFERDGMV